MKVLYALSDMEIELSENYVATLYIENMLYFRHTLQELSDQIAGAEGHWVFTQAQQQLDCKKKCYSCNGFLSYRWQSETRSL